MSDTKATTKINYENFRLHCHLKSLMNKKGISANALSKEIGERRSTLNDLIRNKDIENRYVSTRLIVKLCLYFDVTPSDLFSIVEIDEIDNIE
jgi:DNA-binding Xre family transcriptional regulator